MGTASLPPSLPVTALWAASGTYVWLVACSLGPRSFTWFASAVSSAVSFGARSGPSI